MLLNYAWVSTYQQAKSHKIKDELAELAENGSLRRPLTIVNKIETHRLGNFLFLNDIIDYKFVTFFFSLLNVCNKAVTFLNRLFENIQHYKAFVPIRMGFAYLKRWVVERTFTRSVIIMYKRGV